MENLYANGNENSPKRALLKSTGLTEDDFNLPLVGIVYSQNETVSAHNELGKLLSTIKEGIIAEGAKPMLATVMSICSGLSNGGERGRYLLPSRELIADSVETMVIGSGFDAVVFVGSCDSTIPAMLLAAIRLNLPCIFVSPGCSPAGYFNGERKGFSSLLEEVYGVKTGKASLYDLKELENSCCPSSGSGSEMSTSNTMSCITEALGLSLPYNGTALKQSAKRLVLAKQSGIEIVKALKKQLTPKQILGVSSLINALRFIMATGGSTDAVLHLIALAKELQIEEKQFGYGVIENISAKTPSLVKLAPANNYFMEDFDRAGGVMAVLKELLSQKLLEGNALTVSGKSIQSICNKFETKNEDVIRTAKNCYMKKGAISLLYGNIAEDGCVTRRLFIPEENYTFSGKAKVFDCEEDALFAITSGEICENDCIVIRYEGPKGAPGMREMRLITSAVVGAGLENKVAVITDGRAGGTSKGIVIAHVCPEAAEGGLIAFIEDGDIIDIDINKNKITLNVPAREINIRKKKHKPKAINASGYLLRYAELVTDSKNGTVFKSKF